jgi:hypothetical protein
MLDPDWEILRIEPLTPEQVQARVKEAEDMKRWTTELLQSLGIPKHIVEQPEGSYSVTVARQDPWHRKSKL